MTIAVFSAALLLMQAEAPVSDTFTVDAGTKIPLSLLNSISTKNAAEGDRVYLETVFPVMANGMIVIPVGSNVAGTVTTVKRAGRMKGRAELFVRFDTLILPNGALRDFRSRMSNMDGTVGGTLDRTEGRIEGDGNRAGDMKTIGDAAITGTLIGGIAGAAAGNAGMGLGIGAAAAGTAAMIGILSTRGPDAMLTKGTTVEMLLDRPLTFSEAEVDFSRALVPKKPRATPAEAPAKTSERPGWKTVPGVN
jgi:type IV secretion system protein VirB10